MGEHEEWSGDNAALSGWSTLERCEIFFSEYLLQNLEAFWPGLLSMVGDNEAALKSLHNYHQVIQSLFEPSTDRIIHAGLEAVRFHTRVLQCGSRRSCCAEGGLPSQT